MHVKIDRSEKKKGIFSQRTLYCVDLTVTFSEEEKAIIKRAKLSDDYAILFMMTMEGVRMEHGTKFSQLLKGTVSRSFLHLSEANEWETSLKEKDLPVMKRVLENEKGPTTGTSSFEV